LKICWKNIKTFTSKKSIFQCPKNCQRLVEDDQACKIKNLTIYFWLMKTLLTKQIQLDKRNLKLDV
jgi:hypothetical protein